MKTTKINLFLVALAMLGMMAGISSCEKEEKEAGFKTENLHGTFVGNHKLEISPLILGALINSLPEDPETGEKPDLTKGFNDTLELSVQGDIVKMYSRLLDITVDGNIIADNTFEVEEVAYDVLRLGPLVEAREASIATDSPIKIDSGEIGTETDVKLRLKVKAVGEFSLENPLTVPTNGKFTKTAQ